MRDDRCSALVTTFGQQRRCSNGAAKDGFCNTHHPDVVAARKLVKVPDYRTKLAILARFLSTANERGAVSKTLLIEFGLSDGDSLKDWIRRAAE